MTATIDFEIESGVYAGPGRHHQGYYAGDFSSSGTRPVPTSAPNPRPLSPALHH